MTTNTEMTTQADTTLAIAANQAATPQRGAIPDRVSARNTAGPSISTAPV